MKNNRIYGLDILRILSMMGVIGLHIIYYSGWGKAASNQLETLIVRVMSVICYCSVNTFAMLTGYLYTDRVKHRSSSLLNLLFTTTFYCIVITAFLSFTMPHLFSGSLTLYAHSLFPGHYWYIVCYTLVFVLIPYLNILISALTESQFRRLIIILFLLLSVITTFGSSDYFKLSEGYSPSWLIFCYLTGAYVKRNADNLLRIRLWQLCGIFLCNLLLTLSLWYTMIAFGISKVFPIISYVSPFIVIEATLVLMIFSRISVKSITAQKIILSLSKSALSVYIIHTHIFVFLHILTNLLSWSSKLPLLQFFSVFLMGLIGIYLFCWIIDLIRSAIFTILRLTKLADWIGKKIDALLCWS